MAWDEMVNVVKTTTADVSDCDWVINEDNMASDSDAKVPLQGSVKAYVDTGDA